jgi:hypothetical protein
MGRLFQSTKPTWYLLVAPIALVAMVITWVLRNQFQEVIGSSAFGVIAAVEFVAMLSGIYFHFSYFWNAGSEGKALIGFELFRDTIDFLIWR